MAGHFFHDFQSSSISLATTSLRISVGFFTFHSPKSFVKKKTPRIFGFENSISEKSYAVLNL